MLMVSLLVGIALLDGFGHGEFRTSTLYLLPIALAAWYLGPVAAWILCPAATLLWLATDRLTHVVYVNPLTPYVNALLRLPAYLLVVWFLSTVKSTMALLAEAAGKDALTGLDNMRGFQEKAHMEFERSRRLDRPLTMAYLDLDGFKEINDRFGHEKGNDLLRELGNLLHTYLRAGDIVARLGGDEFAVVVNDARVEEAVATLEAIRRRFRESMGAMGWEVSMSIGAVTFFPVRQTVEEAIATTDRVMYAVKQSGKNSLRHEIVAGQEKERNGSSGSEPVLTRS